MDIKIVAFIGASGTGKSYKAMWVARENNINFIIDDGLLIKGNRIIAGISAKRERTKIASVRRALFLDENHSDVVKKVIKEEEPNSILILGTSIRMIEAIVKKLELPSISKIINIEDVAAATEIKKAQKTRMLEGKHVIPVPTFEIKKDFSGYFIDSLKIFTKRGRKESILIDDKSVVRPTFSYLGEYTISKNVIFTIAKHEATRNEFVKKINKIWTNNTLNGTIINMQMVFKYGIIIPERAKEIQKEVKKAIETYTAINVLAVNIIIQSLDI